MIRRLASISLVLCSIHFTVAAQSADIPAWIQQEKFLRACEDGDVDAVKKYLAAGGSVNVRDRFGQPPLIRVARGEGWSSEEARVATADALLKAGADVNSRNDFGSTAIFLTESASRIVSPLGKFLIERGADVRAKDRYGLEPYYRPNFYDHAKVSANDAVWRLLLEGDLADPPVDVENVKPYSNGATFLMGSVYYADTGGFSANFKWLPEFDKNGESYLFYAATNTRLTGFEYKVIPPGLLNARSKSGETALVRAAQFDNGELILRLLAQGASPDIRDNTGKTALMYSTEYDYFLSTFNLLMKADPNPRDADGRTPLMTASQGGRAKAFVAFAMAKAAIPKLELEARRKPALRAKNAAMATAFKRIEVNARDKKGRTALMLAVTSGNIEVVKTLMSMKANKLIRDNDGRTALWYAREDGFAEIVKLLSKRN